MKKLVNFLLLIAVVTAISWALRLGLAHREGAAESAEAAAGEEEKLEEFTVKIEKEQQELLGLEMKAPERTELRPQRTAFGQVLDPTPLVTLDDDLAAAEAALAASRADFERTQKLLAAAENASRKTAETAEAQFRADEIKANGLRRRAVIEWGSAIAELEPAMRRQYVEQLVHGEAALVRVDLLAGDLVTEDPQSARLVVLGREQQPIDTQSITPAANVDVKTQAQSFILRVNRPPFVLRPGMALTAWLELPDKPRGGFALPRSAILRHDGRTWIYAQEDEEKFVRKPVILEAPLDGEQSWFVAEDGGLGADDKIVIIGGQVLLSEELKAQTGAQPD